MKRVLYYLSWSVLIGLFLIFAIGSVAKQGVGPLILAGVVTLALAGVMFLGDE